MSAILHNSPCRSHRRGIALLTVLMIVLAISILSMGFLARADVERASGRNLAVRLKMDHLADSGLEHARRLIREPQHALSEVYWPGRTALQLTENSRDYYDVSVTRDANDYCTYTVSSEAYRITGTERVGQTRLVAEVRLDPCIAVWTGADMTYRPGWTCTGDLRCAGTLTNVGTIEGDVYANSFSGSALGQQNTLDELSLAWPDPTTMDFIMLYGAMGVTPGTMQNPTTQGTSEAPVVGWCDGDLTLAGNVTWNGALLVGGDLTITGAQNTVVAGKNMPALYVVGDLRIEGATGLDLQGLVVVDQSVTVRADSTDLAVTGALFTGGEILETASDGSGQGNDAGVFGDTTWTGGAMLFGGTDGYLRTEDSEVQLQVANDYTLWVRLMPAATQKGLAGILSRGDPGGTVNHWTLQFDAAGSALIVNHGASTWNTGVDLGTIADGSWHDLAVVRDENDMRTYLDGAEVHSETFDVAPGSGDGRLSIGADITGSSDRVYSGHMDYVRVYASALTASQIQGTAPISAVPLAQWELNEAGSSLTVVAEPARAAIVLPADVVVGYVTDEHWSPAAGAFFRSIERD